MASSKYRELIVSTAITGNGTTTGDGVQVLDTDIELHGIIEVSSRTDGTYTLTLQESHDGTNWSTLKAGSGISANGIEVVKPTAGEGNLKYIRASVVAGSVTTGATIAVSLYCKNSKA
ncbi:hypothetical protein [Nocardia mangyaensis]|uniref:hypothetical protein n=1 Tax=Nocardia mangyaensis TaxID=2213200 RepID=UPI002675ADA5|nr:hypothetical protein [Nocardia mangyaensis]MDO3651367.1 hypothetical protein [Nocardia mangyaensis]